jgi:hypothetical protein
MTIDLRTQNETQINLRMEPLWKHQVLLNGFTAERAGNEKSSKIEMQIMFLYHLLHHHPVQLEVGKLASLEEEVQEERGRRGNNNWVGNSNEPPLPHQQQT